MYATLDAISNLMCNKFIVIVERGKEKEQYKRLPIKIQI